MKHKSKKTRKKYSTGTAVKNYLTDPSSVIAQNQIDIAGAKSQAANDVFTNILSGVGGLAMQQGLSAAGGLGGAAKGIGGLFSGGEGTPAEKALGGKAGNVPVEVERGEVAETPNGELLEFKGKSHKKGGVDVDLPADTDIYSKIIQKDGKSMAERKKIREKREQKINKLFTKSPGDINLKKTLERTQENNKKQEEQDNQIQEMLTQLMNAGKEEGGREKFVGGGTVNEITPSGYDYQNGLSKQSGITETQAGLIGDGESKTGMEQFLDSISGTGGDAIGMIGNITSTFGPMANTEAARASDTPNINYAKDYGKAGLAELDKKQKFLQQTRANRDLAIDSSVNAQQRSARNSARGVNTQRDLSLAVFQEGERQKSASQNTYAQQMSDFITTKADAINAQDKAYISGEAARDTADREDKDNYYSSLATDIASKGTGLQKMGKDLNDAKTAKVMENLMAQLSLYGLKLDSNGKLIKDEKNG